MIPSKAACIRIFTEIMFTPKIIFHSNAELGKQSCESIRVEVCDAIDDCENNNGYHIVINGERREWLNDVDDVKEYLTTMVMAIENAKAEE